MKKFIGLFMVISLFGYKGSYAQCSFNPYAAPLKFTGVAPAPWAIDGQVNDWSTILGAGTGNNASPYNPPSASSLNYSKEPGFIPGDLDAPEPAYDIRFKASIADDHNVYFYLRRLDNASVPGSLLYFCDINGDGYMNTGEPVFGCTFSGGTVHEMTVYGFVPDVNVDYVPGKGNRMYGVQGSVDGYTMKGTLQPIFGSNVIPTDYHLNANEVLRAMVTENGYGIELAIPWQYFRNWATLAAPLTPGDIIVYHLSLQKGASSGYRPQQVKDNVGNCCRLLSYTDNTGINVLNASITGSGLTYHLELTIQNPTNVRETFGLGSMGNVSFDNIQLNPGFSTFPANGFSVVVNGVPFSYSAGSFPVAYEGNSDIIINPRSTATYPIDITFPADHSVHAADIGLTLSDRNFADLFISCVVLSQGPGNHPVVYPITTNSPNPPNLQTPGKPPRKS